MDLIQRKALLPAFIIVSIAAVLGVLIFSSQFVFGQEEPAECNVSTVGLSVLTTDTDGNFVTRVSNGDEIFYRVILSIPELREGDTACNYSGGQLTITTPAGDAVGVAGFEGTPEIPVVSLGTVYEGPAARYTVDQADAENSALTVMVSYSGGSSHSVGEGETRPEAAGSISDQIRMIPPEIEIQVVPPKQLVYLGGTADFTVTVANNGGFELSDVEVSDTLPTDCGRMIDTLAVGTSQSFSCSFIPEEDATNEFAVTGQAVGGISPSEGSVGDSTITEIDVETVAVAIDLTPEVQQVRVGDAAAIMVEVMNTSPAALTDVTVTVPAATECGRVIATLAVAEVVSYECSPVFPQGTTIVTGTVVGVVEGVATLTSSDEVTVEVFGLGLFIEIKPDYQTIHKGTSTNFTITVSNNGDSMLSNVMVTSNLTPDCSRELPDLQPAGSTSYQCSSGDLEQDIVNVVDIEATAPDGGSVMATDSAVVDLIAPATVIDVTQTDAISLRIIINVLTITEANTGDVPLTDPYVEVAPMGERLDIDSPEFIGGDTSADGVLDPGEVWEWRLVTVGVVGEGLVVPVDTTKFTYQATGHGIDTLGVDVTFPAVLTERDTMEVPILN